MRPAAIFLRAIEGGMRPNSPSRQMTARAPKLPGCIRITWIQSTYQVGRQAEQKWMSGLVVHVSARVWCDRSEFSSLHPLCRTRLALQCNVGFLNIVRHRVVTTEPEDGGIGHRRVSLSRERMGRA